MDTLIQSRLFSNSTTWLIWVCFYVRQLLRAVRIGATGVSLLTMSTNAVASNTSLNCTLVHPESGNEFQTAVVIKPTPTNAITIEMSDENQSGISSTLTGIEVNNYFWAKDYSTEDDLLVQVKLDKAYLSISVMMERFAGGKLELYGNCYEY